MYIKIERATVWSSFFAFFLFSRTQRRRQKASLSEGGGKPIGLDGGSKSFTVSSAMDFMFVELPQSQPSVSTAPSRREPFAELNGGDRKPPSPREVASPTGLTEGAWSFAVSTAVNFYARRTPSVSKLTAPSRREPCLKLNRGERKPPALREVASPPGLTEGAWSLPIIAYIPSYSEPIKLIHVKQ